MREYVRVLVGFAQCREGGLETSMKAMQYLQDCIDYLADPDNQLPPVQMSYQQGLLSGGTPQSSSVALPTTASPGRRETALSAGPQQQPALHWFPVVIGGFKLLWPIAYGRERYVCRSPPWWEFYTPCGSDGKTGK
ncbi:Brefeldin A-inhibited guanine nucleotide-exchange protein 1 [Perkinsus olseni]|uniref:Brefeldin A-inhibited guanine nucleotide-exchange protein 1 n=1 Tax=Perkinsus olseni TaxID=32597 RepID=A0A7J6SWP9_PEROL|nr:Brefeldin A-inhibited guanine nucleotide-exchange protein 1 [Perkinsus olseni]